jgi:hypothetical protein
MKHHDVFSKEKQDLGKAINFMYKIDLIEDSPVFVKQFQIRRPNKRMVEDMYYSFERCVFVMTKL